MQILNTSDSSMSSCTVLLEPTVTFIHLQRFDELLDKFLVGFSIYTGLKERLEMAHHTSIFCGCKAVSL
jgi:hypothetical protein